MRSDVAGESLEAPCRADGVQDGLGVPSTLDLGLKGLGV